MELISIIIPVYNAEKYLREAIDSALQQTYKECEVIVVDDGSTDNTPKILLEYRSKIQIISQSNQGSAAACNTGVKACLLYTSPSPRDGLLSRMPSSA